MTGPPSFPLSPPSTPLCVSAWSCHHAFVVPSWRAACVVSSCCFCADTNGDVASDGDALRPVVHVHLQPKHLHDPYQPPNRVRMTLVGPRTGSA